MHMSTIIGLLVLAAMLYPLVKIGMLIGEKASESETERQQVHKWVEQSRQQKEREELERKEWKEKTSGMREAIMAGHKYKEFCRFIDSAPAGSINKIEPDRKQRKISVRYSTSKIRFVADTARGCWIVDPSQKFENRCFFATESNERNWTEEEFTVVCELVNAYVNQRWLALGLAKVNGCEGLFELRYPSTPVSVKAPY